CLCANNGDYQLGTRWVLGPGRVAIGEYDHDIRMRMSGFGSSDADTHVRTAATHQSDVADATHARGGSDLGVARQDQQSTRADAGGPNHTGDLRQRSIELGLAHAAGRVDDGGDRDERGAA